MAHMVKQKKPVLSPCRGIVDIILAVVGTMTMTQAAKDLQNNCSIGLRMRFLERAPDALDGR